MTSKGYLVCLLVLFTVTAFSQKQDSVQNAGYQTALKHLKQGSNSQATSEFTQLINSGFANKEVYLKRGVSLYLQNEFEKAKADLDEAFKARINTAELFE